MTENIKRSSNDWVTTAQLRALLKSNLGLNSRQVTCAKSHSTQYLEITIRDPLVNRAAVKSFAKSFSTWNMDNTDYVSGQSVNVSTTKEVDAAHAAPYIGEIKAMIPRVAELLQGDGSGGGLTLSTGAVLWVDRQGFYVGREQERQHYVRAMDDLAGKDWAVESLALQMSRMLPVKC